MGLFQKAAETYDNMEALAGKEIKGKSPLAPICFDSKSAAISITLTESGDFEKAEKQDKKITIPITKNSVGRSSTSAKEHPHPLCDKLMFICPDSNESYKIYVSQLEDWCNSEFSVPQIRAVLKYVKKGTVREDLSSLSNIKDNSIICWRVRTFDPSEPEDLWTNRAVIDSYTNYYMKKVEQNSEKGFCYILGKELPTTKKHLKGISPNSSSTGVLISANDTSNFTYRGRFNDGGEEALTVSFIASSKAHNALKWLISNDGEQIYNRTFLCWNPKGKTVPNLLTSMVSDMSKEKPTPTNYREILSKKIMSYKAVFSPNDETVLTIFQAANKGRLSISYYSEMKAFDFLDRLEYWDESCSFISSKFGVYSPNLQDIVSSAFGTLRTNGESQSIETDKKISAQATQRLLMCRLEKSPFPSDIMKNAVNKCSKLQLFERNNRERQLFTTCAIIKKYKYDRFKEEYSMALEPEKKNRSYQFGRLLAVTEKAEKDTYDNNEKRETNAIRLQSLFVKRPLYATNLIIEQLKSAYYPKLPVGSKNYYEKLIGEIMLQISDCSDGTDKPLTEDYLMGYYLQKNALYTKKNNEDNETEEN